MLEGAKEDGGLVNGGEETSRKCGARWLVGSRVQRTDPSPWKAQPLDFGRLYSPHCEKKDNSSKGVSKLQIVRGELDPTCSAERPFISNVLWSQRELLVDLLYSYLPYCFLLTPVCVDQPTRWSLCPWAETWLPCSMVPWLTRVV